MVYNEIVVLFTVLLFDSSYVCVNSQFVVPINNSWVNSKFVVLINNSCVNSQFIVINSCVVHSSIVYSFVISIHRVLLIRFTTLLFRLKDLLFRFTVVVHSSQFFTVILFTVLLLRFTAFLFQFLFFYSIFNRFTFTIK